MLVPWLYIMNVLAEHWHRGSAEHPKLELESLRDRASKSKPILAGICFANYSEWSRARSEYTAAWGLKYDNNYYHKNEACVALKSGKLDIINY